MLEENGARVGMVGRKAAVELVHWERVGYEVEASEGERVGYL